jgi:hypothetical protein
MSENVLRHVCEATGHGRRFIIKFGALETVVRPGVLEVIMESDHFAENFEGILPTLSKNVALRQRVLHLIATKPIVGKSTEEPARIMTFRDILDRLVKGEISSVEKACAAVRERLPQSMSKYNADSRYTFKMGWERLLVHTQLSRFYNQAVMELLMENGKSRCAVPHSPQEEGHLCTIKLAGREHNIKPLYDLLIDNYEKGNYNSQIAKIPNHPYCSHVVRPV